MSTGANFESQSRKGRKSMIAEYQAKSNLGIAIGLGLQFLGFLIGNSEPSLAPLATIAFLCGAGALLFGCVCYARGKGRSGAWGILGLTSLLGLILLVLLPDDHA